MSIRFRVSDESFLLMDGIYIGYSICLPEMSFEFIVEVVIFV